VQDVHLNILHAAVVRIIDDHHLIGQLGQSAPFGAHQRDGLARLGRECDVAQHELFRLVGEVQVAELDYVSTSKAAMTTLAENYVGLPYEV
jgi:hypothetical protein